MSAATRVWLVLHDQPMDAAPYTAVYARQEDAEADFRAILADHDEGEDAPTPVRSYEGDGMVACPYGECLVLVESLEVIERIEEGR